MSAPQPLRLTLEEAVVLLGKNALALEHRRYSDAADEWGTRYAKWADVKTAYGSWPEAVSAALRGPVVERDDRAELIEALENLVAFCEEAVRSDPLIETIEGSLSIDVARMALMRAKGEA